VSYMKERVRLSLATVAIIALSVTLFAPKQVQAADAGKIVVDGAFVADSGARKVLLWDVRPSDAFQKGHLPGAVSIGDAATVLREPNSEDFISVAEIEKYLGSAGISPDQEIIVYGNRGGWQAYFGLYTLQYFGAKKVTVFHDGIEGWTEAGRALVSGPAVNTPVALKLESDLASKVAVKTKEMIAKLNQPGVQILDVRTEKEFSGEDIRAIRGGHIPGAINIPYEKNWTDPDTLVKLARRQVSSSAGMSLKPVEGLKALYAKLDPEKETIVYCQSGARASETAGILQHLGFKNVKVYDSSWLGYGNTLDAPAENVTFFNVGLLNSRLSGMQSRIDQLEKELSAAKSAK
jgi:thiosulfate/3-mercaptopyruvate sulfurtransferase